MYRNKVKRLLDFTIALLALILLLPFFLIILFLIFAATQGSPIFLQSRPGKNNRIFKLVKFKTMNERCDTSGKLLPDKDRLNLAGSII